MSLTRYKFKRCEGLSVPDHRSKEVTLVGGPFDGMLVQLYPIYPAPMPLTYPSVVLPYKQHGIVYVDSGDGETYRVASADLNSDSGVPGWN